MNKQKAKAHNLPDALAWLADAPLFIDTALLGRFHDAILQPEFGEGVTTLDITEAVAKKIGGKLGLKGEVTPSKVTKW